MSHTSVWNPQPMDKDEIKKTIIVIIISIIMLAIGIGYKQLWIAIPSGIILHLCLWLLFGNYLIILRKRELDKDFEKTKEIYGKDWLKNPEYKGGSWKLNK